MIRQLIVMLFAVAIVGCGSETNIKSPETMGHGKNMPPEAKDKHIILTCFQHMAES